MSLHIHKVGNVCVTVKIPVIRGIKGRQGLQNCKVFVDTYEHRIFGTWSYLYYDNEQRST